MKELLKEHKWLILCYVMYVSVIVSIALEDARGKDFWPVIIVYCITVPIGIYMLYSLIIWYKKKGRK